MPKLNIENSALQRPSDIPPSSHPADSERVEAISRRIIKGVLNLENPQIKEKELPKPSSVLSEFAANIQKFDFNLIVTRLDPSVENYHQKLIQIIRLAENEKLKAKLEVDANECTIVITKIPKQIYNRKMDLKNVEFLEQLGVTLL